MLSNESLSPPPKKKKKLVYLTHLQAPKNAYLNGKNLFRTPQENCLHAHVASATFRHKLPRQPLSDEPSDSS